MIRFLEEIPSKCTVAFSGGIDSVAVVDFLLNGRKKVDLAFFHHGTETSALAFNFVTKYKYFKELFSCSLCLGFWSGVVVGLIGNYNPAIFATYGAAMCWYADYILDVIIRNGKESTKKENHDNLVQFTRK